MTIRRAAVMSSETLTPKSKGVVDCYILDDWDQIICNIQAGKASEFYQEGDFKEIDMGEWGKNIMIIDKINPADVFLDEAQTTNPNVKWATRYLLGKKITTPDDSNAISWADSKLKKIFNETIFNFLPDFFKNALVPTWKTVGLSPSTWESYPDLSYLRPFYQGSSYYRWMCRANIFIYDGYNNGHYPTTMGTTLPFTAEEKVLVSCTLFTFNQYSSTRMGFHSIPRRSSDTSNGYSGWNKECWTFFECYM